MVGLQVNPSKTVIISYTHRPARPPLPLTWLGPNGKEEITNTAPIHDGTRILGQYLVPSGNMANFTEWMCSYTEQLVKPLVNSLTTDRMAQFVVRTILFPSVEYKLMGIPLSSQ
ncbi:hypothetical protein GQ54DRAFT_313947, partial [Martensiomyces pterosporus]